MMRNLSERAVYTTPTAHATEGVPLPDDGAYASFHTCLQFIAAFKSAMYAIF